MIKIMHADGLGTVFMVTLKYYKSHLDRDGIQTSAYHGVDKCIKMEIYFDSDNSAKLELEAGYYATQ